MDGIGLQTLDPFATKPKNDKPVPIGGRVGFFDDDFERTAEALSQPSIIPNVFLDEFANVPKSVLDPTVDIIKESKSAVVDLFKELFPSKGNIDFQKPRDPEEEKKKHEAAYQKSFYQALETSRKDNEKLTLEQSLEEAARLTVSAMGTEEMNKTLKLNFSLERKHTQNAYHIHTLRRIKMEEFRTMQQEKQSQELASQKGNNLMGNMNAQEGQSMVSASGAILTAG